jgi:uncharacterized RDD family membrane protein YckC
MNDRGPVGVGPRAVAFLIDWLLFAFMIAVVWVVSGGVNSSAENNLITNPNAALELVITAAALVYFGGLESAWGTTVGKRALGLRVVMLDATPVTGRAVLIRTLGRILDCFLFTPIVAAIFVWASPRNQRIGDRWAHTVVVRTRRRNRS